MVSSAKLIEVIAERLCYYKAQNIVVDPVMVSTSGSKLIQDDALDVLKPVSYTHLDVYKRQIVPCSLIFRLLYTLSIFMI